MSMAILSMDEKGIYPHPVAMIKDGETSMMAMDVQPDELYAKINKITNGVLPTELIIGMDRINMEGQGIDMKFNSAFTIAHWKDGAWKIGVLPYSSISEVGEHQWDNEFWIGAVTRELKAFSMIDPSVEDVVVGTVYKEKISLTSYTITKMGSMYEGFINVENISSKLKEYLKDHNLDINDRGTVIDHIKNLGHKFEFTAEDFGFWTLHAGDGIFPARKSKSKVYLEGVEAILEKTLKEA